VDPEREWYLEELVRLARSLRFERVVLETAATGLRAEQAPSLADAGLSAARVTVHAVDARVGDVDGPAIRGARGLLDANVPLEIVVPLARDNRGELARLVADLPRRLRGTRAAVERVVAVHLMAGGRTPPLSLREAADEIAAGALRAREAGVALTVAHPSPPPCMFYDLEGVATALPWDPSLGESGSDRHVRLDLCEGCGARHVCPGPLRAAADEVASNGRRVSPEARGVPPTRERQRVLRELTSVLFQRGPDGAVEEHRVLRVNFHCNQACDFCFVSRELPPPEDELLQAELCDVAARGASLAISGGEPTLNPRLPAYIARAVELGIRSIQLQTNAIKMSDPKYASELHAAGLRMAFVSLHGTTAATSDRVTAAPGTFVRTIAGIKNLLAAGVAVCLNFVLCAYNASELAGLPDFVARELLTPGARLDLNFSFVAAGSENVPRDTGLIPRFTDVAWALEASLDRARALGIPFLGFDSQCGVPACFLPEEVRAAWFVEDLPAAEVEAFAGAFRKGEACTRCVLARRCYGLRAAYADTYGTGELRPILAGDAGDAGPRIVEAPSV
jgi:MoaA/NifB/PqqE/SkfB family radical SAM enzyme